MKYDVQNSLVAYAASWQECTQCGQEDKMCITLEGLPHGPDPASSQKQLAADSAVCLACLQSMIDVFKQSERTFRA